MKLAFVGTAHVHAGGYAEALARIPDVELSGVYDRNLGSARSFAANYGARAFGDPFDCARSADAVIVCSENAYHAESVQAAAQAGRPVLCEKPLASTVKEARAIQAVCERTGVPLQMAFPCRYDPSTARAREHLEAGRIGQVLAVRGTNRGQMPGGWFADPGLSGGGAVMDHTVHVVDLLRYLLATEVEEVYAVADTRLHDIAVDDCAMLSFRLDGGILATLDPSWSRPDRFPTWGDVTLEFVGTVGTLWVDLFSQNVNAYRLEPPTLLYEPYGTDMSELLLRDFVDMVSSGRAPFVGAQDGVRATAVVEAAYESVRTGRPAAVER